MVWDLDTGKVKHELTDNFMLTVTALEFSPDGKLLAGGGPNNSATQVWDVETGKVKHVLKASICNRLEKLIQVINKRFVNTSPEALTRICKKGVVMAVAGGPHKTGAIADVLKSREKGSPWITHLITDDQVALKILHEI